MKFRSQQQGIALVITLIMLSVTLIMAVAFLAISTRERGSVSTSTDATHSREAAETALAAAESQIVASMLATMNAANFGMFVSTNYLHQDGFITASGPGTGISGATNVNYYYTNGLFLSGNDYQLNIANLWYLPRAPVFVPNNSPSGYDFRFYLDLNRNGQFDGNNNVSNLVYYGEPLNTFSNLGPLTNAVGDPEWIGVLEHPDQPHGPLNHFIARYAFIAVPVGNTLDVNAMYNDATIYNAQMIPGSDGYLRNEGVGSWELNLAAFLADLNTNEWDTNNLGYDYVTPGALQNNGMVTSPNRGVAFEDALALLRYRYNNNVYNQTNVTQYARNGIFATNNIDDFSDGPLLTNNIMPPDNDPARGLTDPWAGSDNTNHFFSLSDFFKPGIFRPGYLATNGFLPATTPVFVDRLLNAGTNARTGPVNGAGRITAVPTYDRYTFYRMLAQLGTDSTPDYGKMNLNYVNVDNNGDVVPGAETNFIPWNASQFFTNAADRLLKTYTTNWYAGNPLFFTNDFGTNIVPFGVANIPVSIGGKFAYTPAVNRLLQLAANMYDASTTNQFPSVFRPTFYRDPQTGNIFINGYQQVTNIVNGLSDPRLFTPVDVSALIAGNVPPGGAGNVLGLNNINVYGVPWIIGAKKGLPSFNQLYMVDNAQVTRKLQVNRPPAVASGFTTNEMFTMGLNNTVGMSCWNSYYSNYVSASGNITVFMSDTMRMMMTNATMVFPSNNPVALVFTNIQNFAVWPGSAWNVTKVPQTTEPVQNSPAFVSVIFTNVFMPISYYRSNTSNWYPIGTNDPSPQDWETNVVSNYLFPKTGLTTTNYAQAFILDGNNVIDYVQFSGPNITRNLADELADPNYPDSTLSHYMWSTNSSVKNSLTAPPAFGEYDQMLLSRGIGGITAPSGPYVWSTAVSLGGDSSPAAQQAFFNAFWSTNGTFVYGRSTYSNTLATDQAPYTPSKIFPYYTNWVANDPLVHYLASDLVYNYPGKTGVQKYTFVPPSLNMVSDRYQPWGVSVQMAGIAGLDTNAFNLAYKDPMVVGPDYWNFPTNLYPTVGWLGRVHRGTPWQTVYLKSTDILPLQVTNGQIINVGTNTWQNWSGNTANYYDAANAAPVNDRLLFEIFTTGINDNATRGELSVNQPQFAAWSALLSGIPLYTNLTGPSAFVQPGGEQGTNSPLGYIWNSIQQTRANTNLFSQQYFARAGDVLASPGLTVNSPFLPWDDTQQMQSHSLISDQMYEWLPQEMMSLVKVGSPSYVIYCYGQGLKPAPNGLITSGPYALMCTNYQITSESAVRAVVQVQNPGTATPHVLLQNVNPVPPDQ